MLETVFDYSSNRAPQPSGGLAGSPEGVPDGGIFSSSYLKTSQIPGSSSGSCSNTPYSLPLWVWGMCRDARRQGQAHTPERCVVSQPGDLGQAPQLSHLSFLNCIMR